MWVVFTTRRTACGFVLAPDKVLRCRDELVTQVFHPLRVSGPVSRSAASDATPPGLIRSSPSPRQQWNAARADVP